ncbi:TlpA family protein disulfide reductase [Polaribacter sp. ALD11]|uniref:TlpA family protein disulfide reductase n=1 Tax=Polaribacter sp. ALD11 TaxID=2058137 RepID=UPI000C3190B1|nr:TlpA disulfide reductase family protein [Polaribacter sp. ALD11]AUC86189.1 TlpA family protein disulfide reductase [Polaribacter sp. ALD11]
MKKIGLLIAIITMVSCKPENKVNYTIVSGKIENATSKKVTIYSRFDTSLMSEIELAEDGTFKDTLKMNSDFYFLREGKNMTDFYAPSGSNTNINYDSKKKDSTLTLAGTTSTINNYLLNKSKTNLAITGDQEEMYLKNEEDFKAHLLKIKTAEEDLLFKTDGIPEDFKINEKKNINYAYLTTLNNYQPYHGYYIKDRSFKASDNFLNELDDLDIDNETDFLFSGNYRNLVSTSLKEKAQKLVEKDSLERDIAYLKTIVAVKSDVIKNKLLYDDARYGITYTENLEEYYALFSKNSTNVENNKKITKDYNKLKSLAKGNPSPNFTDYEDNAGGTKSLEDLKGKYVYIDVWATWCGPCIAEIPSLKQVEKDFHGRNIQFLSISIDVEKDHEKWKKMIVDKELGGMQLMADSDWKSQFIEDYMIKGIPRFILLDPQGNIVNANAPRPSDKKLIETLNGLNL